MLFPMCYRSEDVSRLVRLLCSSAIFILVILSFPNFTIASRSKSQLVTSQRQIRTREGFAISPKNCQIASEHGTCMFVWECLKTDGKHLGMCMDGFMFGSCCVHNDNNNQLTDFNDLSHQTHEPPEDDLIIQPLDLDQDLDDKIDILLPDDEDDIKLNHVIDLDEEFVKPATETIKISEDMNDDTESLFSKYKPTTAANDLSDGDDIWSAYPTRPSRPTKPTVRWPTFHKVPSHQVTTTTSTSTTITEESTTKHRPVVHFPLATRPTKKPPPLVQVKTTARPLWSWEDKRTSTTAVSTTTQVPITTTGLPEKHYFPSSSAESESNHIKSQTPVILKNGRPTRPTRPPKPSSFDMVTYFPPMNIEQPQDVSIIMRTPMQTTSTTTTTESTTTTTESTTTTVSMHIVPTPRPPIHFMPPPRLSTTALSTPNPPPATPVNAQPTGGCGVPVLNKSCPKGRIVNGTQSCYGQFPWQVSVRRTSFFGFSSTHRCGGALINELWVATAGHCVDDLLVPKIRVRIGEWDFSSTSEPQGFVELKVVNKIVHPKYNFFTYEYDLALVKLERKITFQENIIPICLPGNDDNLVGEIGVVAGWGRLSEGGQLPNILQYVSVPIVSNDKCKEMFQNAGRHEVIPEIFMCAGYDGGGRDSCQGDSGGPLVVKGNDGRYFLGGIISWGIGCAEPNLPGVCTRISKFTEWIMDQVT